MIPKIINHIWLQGNIPDKYIDNYKDWGDLHPLWEHKIWDETSLVLLCSKEQINQYKKLNTLINRVNFLKYILMYNVGGVYADLDTHPLKSIDDLLNEHILKDIDIDSLLSIYYPFNTEIPNKKFKDYNIIIPSRRTLSFYPNGDKSLLLDNPFLISNKKNPFWINLIEFCLNRTNLKKGFNNTLSQDCSHEPLGPYGMTDFLFNGYHYPYKEGILVIPPIYWSNIKTKSDNKYIIHDGDCGW